MHSSQKNSRITPFSVLKFLYDVKLVDIVRDRSNSKKFMGDQDVYSEGYLEQDLSKYTLLSPVYNLNSQICATAKHVRVYHLYQHKPWYDKHWERKLPKCVKELRQYWRETWWSVELIARSENVQMAKFDTFTWTEPGIYFVSIDGKYY